ncbi:type II secretion system F family protein [Thermoactinomyces mirandus]|uniref:Type II secretion system F family protein n=1 Tax=Thermoactinomyces mirandus TaxID=2756294 RepID=A0A7W2AQG5_9BACL|nr:type II secretion system F family protein [Thermoactinomyces mirandus]MBA4601282.1 type II secretion system F family protein [Thermoactinomyces mirandus]
MIIAIFGTAAVFCFMIAICFWLQMRVAKSQTAEVLEKYIGNKEEISWSDRLADRLDQQSWAKKLEPELKRASINLRPSEYGALLLLAEIGLIFLLIIGFDAPFFLSLLIASFLVPFGSKMLINSRKFLYVRKIEDHLSEACRLLSSAARAGLSIPQGLELVEKEMHGPIKEELGIVVKELQLGRNLETSLKEMLERVPSRDMQVFVNALIIQRRAGGDLAKVLSEMANTMEERKIIHKTIDATVAQSRYSAYLLPIVSLLVVFMMSKMLDGFIEFFSSIYGMIVLGIFIILQIIGFILIKKIADIKV